MRGVEEKAGGGGGGGELGGVGGVGGGGVVEQEAGGGELRGMVMMVIHKKTASTMQKTDWTNCSCPLNPIEYKTWYFFDLITPGGVGWGRAGLPPNFFLFS